MNALLLPDHPKTGLTALGLLNGLPVWPVLGGSGEGEDEGTDDEVTEDEGAETEVEEGAEEEAEKPAAKKPADDRVSRAELVRATAARDAAKKALRDERAANAKLKQQGEDESARAIREAGEAAQAAADKKYKPLIIATSAKAELVAAGVKPERVARLTKLLDLADIEIDDDGAVIGLTDQVEALKEEWPEFFEQEKPATREVRPGSRAADGADKRPAAKRPLTATEQQAAMLAGKG